MASEQKTVLVLLSYPNMDRMVVMVLLDSKRKKPEPSRKRNKAFHISTVQSVKMFDS